MRLKYILIGLVVAVLAVIAVAFTVVMTTDFNDYRDLVQERMKAATGRDLVIAGDIGARFSLSPRVSARQVSFGNAPWSDIPQMASLDEIEAEYIAAHEAGQDVARLHSGDLSVFLSLIHISEPTRPY